jgi:malate permease and related proteins
VIETAFSALVMIAIGMLLRRFGVVKREHASILVQLTLYVLLPALVLDIMVGANLDWGLVLVPFVAFAATAVMAPLGLLFARSLRLGRSATGAVILMVAIANTGFFGLPLIAASGGDYSLPVALMYDALGTGVLIWTFNPLVASWFGRGEMEDAVGVRRAMSGLLLPPMWALVIGLILNLSGVRDLWDFVQFPVQYLAAALLPVVMLYAGMVLDWSGIADNWRIIAGVSVLKLALMPLVAFGAGYVLGFRGGDLETLTVLGAMPSGMMALVMGAYYRLPVSLLAGGVAVTTVLALFTIPFITAVIH